MCHRRPDTAELRELAKQVMDRILIGGEILIRATQPNDDMQPTIATLDTPSPNSNPIIRINDGFQGALWLVQTGRLNIEIENLENIFEQGGMSREALYASMQDARERGLIADYESQ